MSLYAIPADEFFALITWAFDGIAVWAPDPWHVVYANQPFQQLAMAPAEVPATGPAPLDGREPAFPVGIKALIEDFGRGISTQSTLSARVDVVGGRPPVEVRLCRLGSAEKPLIGMIVRAANEPPAEGSDAAGRLDPLTGLPDREFLLRRLAVLLRGDRSADRQFAVLFLDLDNFKQVNDEFGHLIGDNVLREAAQRIASCVREGDHVIRFGGDEFVVLVEGVAGPDEVEPVIKRIQAALATPIALPEGEVTLALSIGMSLASSEHGSPEELLAAADRAMYAAKRSTA